MATKSSLRYGCRQVPMWWTSEMEGYTESSYGDGIADVYDDWYGDLDDSDFATYLATVVHPLEKATVLELGVGTGRLLEAFVSARGHSHDVLHGVDSSTEMLSRLRSGRAHLGCTAQLCDMSVSLPDELFDLVFAGYNTIFNLADDDALSRCFSLISDRMSPEGSFVLDAVVPVTSTGQSVTVRSMTVDRVVLTISRFHAESQRIEGQFVELTESGGVKLRPWMVRYWSPAQLDECAGRVGLRLVERYERGDGSAFAEDSPRHISRYMRRN